ncbi:MAG: RDD family protein [Acidobacteriota bacterium]|nr:RDD family protein [Acidobacteriota bacterium]
MALLDTAYSVETPEGVGIDFSLAGPLARGLAWLIDLIIRIIAYTVIAVFLGMLGLLATPELTQGALLLLAFIGEWFYPVLFEVYKQGRTPGKMALKLRVVTTGGAPVGWRGSMLRNLLRVVDFLPFFNGLGLIAVLFSNRFQRLGDMVAGTLVVYAGEDQPIYQIPECTPAPPFVTLKLNEQRALIAFSERTERLSGERVEELADILEPATGKKGEDAVQLLWSNAAWLVGRRP